MDHRDDAMTQLRAADPAARAELGRVDTEALADLRTGITATPAGPQHQPAPRRTVRRLSRRGTTTAGVAIAALLGSGGAYAAIQQGWYVGGGGVDGITCVTRWVDPTQDIADSTGGPALTGDPVADCQRYQELSGLPPIEDGVAFQYGTPQVWVAPRDQVPTNATVLTPTVDDGPEYELWQSLYDMVDGLGAQCLSGDEAAAAAQMELTRLGLTGWTVQTRERPQGWAEGPCADVGLGTDLGGEPDTLVVTPDAGSDRDALNGDGIDPLAFELRDTLRTGIAQTCVSLAEAQALATEAVGDGHHWPTTAILDEDASCTRVDLLVGGSILVTLRGPESITD